jgi:hypothetical protein
MFTLPKSGTRNARFYGKVPGNSLLLRQQAVLPSSDRDEKSEQGRAQSGRDDRIKRGN